MSYLRPAQLPFKCSKCGDCCKQVVGQRFGLALTLEEALRLKAFAERHQIDFQVQPLARDTIRVTLYQMTQNPCPFLNQWSRCRCYAIRPTVCRMFPLHPNGLMACTETGRRTRAGFMVDFDREQRQAALHYWENHHGLIRSAALIYDLNRGWMDPQRLRQERQVWDL